MRPKLNAPLARSSVRRIGPGGGAVEGQQAPGEILPHDGGQVEIAGVLSRESGADLATVARGLTGGRTPRS